MPKPSRFLPPLGLALGLTALFLMTTHRSPSADGPMPSPVPAAAAPLVPTAADTPARATFGGGCFWCTEAVFEALPGVHRVTSGYAGGHTDEPTYDDIGTGRTGHAEVIQIEYDPTRVSYDQLLTLFWEAHDPTTLNRQGADVGTQYRSIILFESEAQREAAEISRRAVQAEFDQPIVTEVAPLRRFWPAEGYHQDYFARNPSAGYCAFVIRPKLSKLRKSGALP